MTLALWADRVTINRALGMSPFELVYGTDVVFPYSLGRHVVRLLHEEDLEPNPTLRRIY